MWAGDKSSNISAPESSSSLTFVCFLMLYQLCIFKIALVWIYSPSFRNPQRLTYTGERVAPSPNSFFFLVFMPYYLPPLSIC